MNIRDHRYYFGVYANMARHNVFMILNDIAAKLGQRQMEFDKEELVDKGGNLLPSVFEVLKGTDKVLQSNLLDLLYYHFPFLKVLSYQLYPDNSGTVKYYQLLQNWLCNLERLRNYYTHVYHNEVVLSDEVFGHMDRVFDDALDVTKNRFELDEDKDNLDIYRRWKGKKKANPDFEFPFTDEKGQLTEKGLAFFICLFLEKEYVNKFLKELAGFESNIPREIYCIYRCMTPQHKLKSNTGSEALLLDMLNELQRCPKELYQLLGEADRQRFITREEEGPDEIQESVLMRKKDRFPYFALRYIEYMNTLPNLLAQIDMGKYIFYTYKKTGPDKEQYLRRWEKNIHVFGRLNEIEKEYPEVLQKVKTDPFDITDETPPPYLVETNPHYHFVDNTIAFKIRDDAPLVAPFKERTAKNTGAKIGMPVNRQADIVLSTYELCGLLFYDHLAIQYKTDKRAENIILEYKDNFNKLLDDITAGKVKPVDDERIVNQYQQITSGDAGMSKQKFEQRYKERKGLLAALLQQYRLEPHMIPDKLENYLMAVSQVTSQDKAGTILQELLEKNDTLLKEAESEGKEKNRKKEKIATRTKHLKAGERATFLAQDMLYFQPHTDAQGKDAPNPDEYQKLQAALAFFSRDKEHIERIFLMCGLTHSKNPHPFLDRIDINKCKTNNDFYTRYLKERRKYLNDCLKQNLLDPEYWASIHFLDLRQELSDDNSVNAYVSALSDKAINLPRGLFKDAIMHLIGQHGSEELKQIIADSTGEPNIVYLLQKYLELSGDKSQLFYNYERNYRVVEEFYDTRDRKNKKAMLQPIAPKPQTTDELSALAILLNNDRKTDRKHIRTDGETHYYDVYRKVVIDNEKLVRYYRSCDIMSYFMCRELFVQSSHDANIATIFDGQPFLQNMVPDNAKSILNTSIEYKLALGEKSISDTIKIKDYGKFRKFLKDRRLNRLLDYYEGDTIQRFKLKEQLDTYEKVRIALFEHIHEFEKACANNSDTKMVIDEKLKKPGYVSHRELLNKYGEIKNLSGAVIQYLNMIRNAFSHNQFPEYEKMKHLVREEGRVIEGISQYALGNYEMMTTDLNK